MIGIALSAV